MSRVLPLVTSVSTATRVEWNSSWYPRDPIPARWMARWMFVKEDLLNSSNTVNVVRRSLLHRATARPWKSKGKFFLLHQFVISFFIHLFIVLFVSTGPVDILIWKLSATWSDQTLIELLKFRRNLISITKLPRCPTLKKCFHLSRTIELCWNSRRVGFSLASQKILFSMHLRCIRFYIDIHVDSRSECNVMPSIFVFFTCPTTNHLHLPCPQDKFNSIGMIAMRMSCSHSGRSRFNQCPGRVAAVVSKCPG